MVYFASGGSSETITFSSAGFISSAAFIPSAGLFSSAGFTGSAAFIASAGLIASAGFSASAGFNASAGFFASAGFSGIIAHAKPCASHKKKLAKRHTKTRPAKRNTTWPFVLAAAYNPIEKKATVANEKPPAKRPSRRDKTLMRLLI